MSQDGESDVVRWTADPENLRLYQREWTTLQVTEAVCEAMNGRDGQGRMGVTRSELARFLGKKKYYVNRFLNGDLNLTLRQVSDAFTALGRQMTVGSEPLEVERFSGLSRKCVEKKGE